MRAREARRKIFQLWMHSAKDVWERDYKLQSGNETRAKNRVRFSLHEDRFRFECAMRHGSRTTRAWTKTKCAQR